MSCPIPAPTCGTQGISGPSSTVSSILSTLLGIGSAVGTGASIYGYITLTVNHTVTAPAPITIFGITAPLLVWVAAVVGALVTWGTVFGFYYERCLADPDTEAACSAGVIEDTV